jgi:hypothetical protein
MQQEQEKMQQHESAKQHVHSRQQHSFDVETPTNLQGSDDILPSIDHHHKNTFHVHHMHIHINRLAYAFSESVTHACLPSSCLNATEEELRRIMD